MFTGKIAQIIIAAVFATTYLTSNVASASFTPPVAPLVQSQAQADGRGVQPDYPPCYGYGSQTYWVEVSTSPETWALEQYGRYCPPKILFRCVGTFGKCDFLYIIHAFPVRRYFFNTQFYGHINLVPIGSNGVDVITTGGKTNIVGVLSLGNPSGNQSATAVSFDAKSQITYVSVSASAGGSAGLLVYQSGATTPSSMLSAPGATQAGGGVAVDSKGNVFWGYNDASGLGHIAEFVDGKFAREIDVPIGSSNAGDLAVDNKDNLVASWPALSMITVISMKPKPHMLSSFTTTGAPNSISLDAKNANVYVADTTNNLIDQYSYPSGTLVSSSAPPQLDGQTPLLQTVIAPDPQAP